VTLECLLESSSRAGITGRLDDDRDHARRPQLEDSMPQDGTQGQGRTSVRGDRDVYSVVPI
jgi:hypothetical protein